MLFRSRSSFAGASVIVSRRHVADGNARAMVVISKNANVATGERGMRDADLAREVGVPPWKLRSLRDQARGWTDVGLARAIRAVAQADADIKGAASDASYALERLVLTITALRQR